MTRWVAFLRAINVGGHTVKNAHLKALFEALDFTNVETFIASGNVVFDASSAGKRAALENKIETRLHAALGYEVATFLRTLDEVCEIAEHKPFGDVTLADGESLIIGFLKAQLNAAQHEQLMLLKTQEDNFATDGANMYWMCRTGQAESTFSNARFEKSVRVQATFRNTTTIRRLVAKFSPGNAET